MVYFPVYILQLVVASLTRLQDPGSCDVMESRDSHQEFSKMSAETDVKVKEMVRGQEFEVGPRYQKLAFVGEGAYGMVV